MIISSMNFMFSINFHELKKKICDSISPIIHTTCYIITKKNDQFFVVGLLKNKQDCFKVKKYPPIITYLRMIKTGKTKCITLLPPMSSNFQAFRDDHYISSHVEKIYFLFSIHVLVIRSYLIKKIEFTLIIMIAFNYRSHIFLSSYRILVTVFWGICILY